MLRLGLFLNFRHHSTGCKGKNPSRGQNCRPSNAEYPKQFGHTYESQEQPLYSRIPSSQRTMLGLEHFIRQQVR